MNLVKIIKGKDLLDIENKVNDFLIAYKGELLQFQVIKDDTYNQYEAIFSYKQSDPNQKELTV